jgi:hypothetical protein
VNALKNSEVVAADQETEDIKAVTEDQHTVEEMVVTDSEIEEEEEDQDPEVMTPETNTTEEEEIPEIEAHQEVAVTEDRDQEATTGIEEDPTNLTAILLLGPTTAEMDPQNPEVMEEDQTRSMTLDRATTVIAEVAINNLSTKMTVVNTAAEELDLTVPVRRPTEDKVATAEVPLTESTMTTTSTVEITTAVNSEEKNKRTPKPRKEPTEKMVFKTACQTRAPLTN